MTDTTTTEAPATETNKTELVMSRDGLIATPASSVQVQARTLMIPRPAVFYLEPARQLRQADAGNSHDQISKGVHQVDPSRTVGMSPLMPNLALFKETGNPFPKRPDATVKTSPKFVAYVGFLNATFSVLKRKKEPVKATEILDEVIKMSKIGADDPKKALKILRDCLRDLRLYGFLLSSGPGSNANGTRWALAPDLESIELLS